MSRPIIEVEGLSKKYRLGVVGATTLRDDIGRMWLRLRGATPPPDEGEFWALRDVSFSVQPGEVVGIIGRNGAGKSTLLKILSRITEPTSGRATLRGRVASLLEVGTGFHPDLTGRENVYLNGSILGMKRAEISTHFDEIVAFADVAKFIDTPVKHYSSGMRVRLAFAVAAFLDAQVLIIDEVLAVGDAAFQERCMGKLDDDARAGRTILVVSHNSAMMQHLCTKCIHLLRGQVKQVGTPADIIAEHLAEARPEAGVALRTWHDRSGTGEALVTELAVLGPDAKPLTSVPFGGTLNIRLKGECRAVLNNVMVGVVIHNAAGEPLLDLQSAHRGLRLDRVQGDFVIEGKFENIGLYPGKYLLSPWITAGAENRSVDFARMCTAIRVIPQPGRFGDLKLDGRWGKYWVDSTWRVLSHDASVTDDVPLPHA
ncbi:ABC transporter ATP-binding protein [Opitutus sp. ER46]|uniref:ABC transporter ATP-binding protein n=1 Tax=Opitutus sp. ER46 TaxID=2161864 RepID=UPI000D30D610|nr:ABC transporter ATP-binding protein [Opitutus sp. ER46]PTX91112.1 ABC transporter ATP-binding protein [Opitutus sp. ER46]